MVEVSGPESNRKAVPLSLTPVGTRGIEWLAGLEPATLTLAR